jgi:hypothetical protein
LMLPPTISLFIAFIEPNNATRRLFIVTYLR